MGREVRYVTADWEPHDEPLWNGLDFPDDLEKWERGRKVWEEEGKYLRFDGEVVDKPFQYADLTWTEYNGPRPDPSDYTSVRPGDELTHMVVYENTSEGTPISPAFEIGQEEELAQWLVDHEASAFGSMTATKEEWLGMIQSSGWAPSGVQQDGEWKSGVAYMSDQHADQQRPVVQVELSVPVARACPECDEFMDFYIQGKKVVSPIMIHDEADMETLSAVCEPCQREYDIQMQVATTKKPLS